MDSEGNKDECEEVFLDEQDIDEEELPEVDDESNSDVESDSDSDFEGICAVACSPTDSTLVAAGGSGTGAFLWNINQGDQRQVIIGNDDSVSSVAFSADGKFLACGTGQGRVQVWDICSSSHKCTFDGPEDIEWVRWHPRGHFVLAGSMDDFTVWLWDIDEDAYLYTLLVTNVVSLVAILPQMVAQFVQVLMTHHCEYGIQKMEITYMLFKVVNSLISHEDLIQCVGLSPRLPLVATGGGKELIIWEITHSLFRVWSLRLVT
ncbi:hypothetical protein IFM89_029822 [Coptis chinensis]|uniref:Uncharacterized protein n=1 Tax=Coptis chinensis TaxID=261450 RepID=A0A835HQS6_9MAGN|nr:hypothetical protein IFM89_029822 [Coptis chinensis]